MTKFDPVSGITKNQLFDNIITNIDGNGWSLIKDTRDPNRVVTATGFEAITRSSEGEQNTNIDHTTFGYTQSTDSFWHINQVVKDGGTIYLFSTFIRGSSEEHHYATSGNGGITWSVTSRVSSHQRLVSPSRMGDGTFWFLKLFSTDSNTNTSQFAQPNQIRMNSKIDNGVWQPNSTPIVEGSGSDAAGTALDVSGNGFPVTYRVRTERFSCVSTYKESDTRLHFFVNVVDTATSKARVSRITLDGSDFDTAINNLNVGTNDTATLATEDDLGLDNIYGLQGIVKVADNVFDFYLLVIEGGLLQTNIYRHNGAIDATTYNLTLLESNHDFGKDQGATQDRYFAGFLSESGNTESLILADYDIYPLNNPNSTTGFDIRVKNFQQGVDGIPDYNGLEYEYVILKSDYTANNGLGYYLMLLQPNPIQVTPPTVTGITDTLPIFARVIRDYNLRPDRFYFDPIIPTGTIPNTQNVLAPCMFTVPQVGADPEETFRMWMRVDERQVFVFTEATNGKQQSLHCNILEPALNLRSDVNANERNDNIVLSSSGVDNGYGAIALGRNGEIETDLNNIRADNRNYYPRVFEKSYENVLNAVNSVDNKLYAFDVFAANNESNFGTSPVDSYRYVAGKYVDTKFLSYSANLATGDTITVDGQLYMFFSSSDSLTDDESQAVIKDLIIRWS